MRFPSDLFKEGVPSAPTPGNVKARSFAGLITPPRLSLMTADVELYVCADRPHWPNEERARRDNACFGPIANEAGEFLTGVSYQRSILTTPTPPLESNVSPVTAADRIRGIAATVDEKEVLWICEQWMSKEALKARGQYVEERKT
jgi:hypothetical protein